METLTLLMRKSVPMEAWPTVTPPCFARKMEAKHGCRPLFSRGSIENPLPRMTPTANIADGGQHVTMTKVAEGNILGIREGGMPYLAADRTNGRFRDRLYAVWTDAKSGRNEIYLSYSSDRGTSWSSPKRVNDDFSRPEPG